MKTKRTVLFILTLCIALLFTACSGKEAASTEKSQDTKLNPVPYLRTIPTLN